MFKASLGVLDVVIILLIIRTDTDNWNSKIYQAIQIRVLQLHTGIYREWVLKIEGLDLKVQDPTS